MPNTAVNLSAPYDLQMQDAQRQQRLAEMLQQQSVAPIQVQQGGGAPAPISWMSVLAKGLQGYDAGHRESVAADNIKQAGLADSASAAALAKQLMGTQTNTLGTSAMPSQQTQISAPTTLPGQAPQKPVTVQGTIPGMDAQPGQTTMTPPDPQQAIAAILAARGGPQTQAIQNSMLPQIFQRQNTDYAHALQRQDKQDDNKMPMSTAMTQQIAAQSAAAQANARFTNELPQTANERAATGLGYAQLNKPIAVPFGGQMYDPRSRAMFTPSGGMGSAEPTPIDTNSKSLNAVTGLSQLAIDRLTGAPNQPRTSAIVTRVDDEIKNYSIKNNVDLATLRARAQGINNVVTQNTMRNNQGNILEREIKGSVENLGPLLDQMKAGQINKANVFSIWAGRQVNDPIAQQAADQLSRFRNELAGYNAVAGGHLMENGTPAPTPADFAHVDKLISDGINSGGARAVQQSISMSAEKNRQVLKSAVDDANQELWDAFGVGQHYKREAQQPKPIAAPGGNARTIVRTGMQGGRKVVQYSDGTVDYAP